MTHLYQQQGVQFVVFSIHGQLYACYIEEVVEILRVPVITEIPGVHSIIEGVINLRGNIIPVVNLHKRFQLPQPSSHKKNRIVIVQSRQEYIGLMVEEVKMVTTFDVNNVEKPSGQHVDEAIFESFAKWDHQVIGILQLEKVLHERG